MTEAEWFTLMAPCSCGVMAPANSAPLRARKRMSMRRKNTRPLKNICPFVLGILASPLMRNGAVRKQANRELKWRDLEKAICVARLRRGQSHG